MSDARLTEAWRVLDLPRRHDLLDGRYPLLSAAVGALRAARRSSPAG